MVGVTTLLFMVDNAEAHRGEITSPVHRALSPASVCLVGTLSPLPLWESERRGIEKWSFGTAYQGSMSLHVMVWHHGGPRHQKAYTAPPSGGPKVVTQRSTI